MFKTLYNLYIYNIIYINYYVYNNLASLLYSKDKIISNNIYNQLLFFKLRKYSIKLLSLFILSPNIKDSLFIKKFKRLSYINYIQKYEYLNYIHKSLHIGQQQFKYLYKNYILNRETLFTILNNIVNYDETELTIVNTHDSHYFNYLINVNNTIYIDMINSKIIYKTSSYILIDDIIINIKDLITTINYINYFINITIYIDKYTLKINIKNKKNLIFILDSDLNIDISKNIEHFIINNINNRICNDENIIFNGGKSEYDEENDEENDNKDYDKTYSEHIDKDRLINYINCKYRELYNFFINHEHNDIYISKNDINNKIKEFKDTIIYLEKNINNHDHDCLYIKKDEYNTFYKNIIDKIKCIENKLLCIINNRELIENLSEKICSIVDELDNINKIINEEKDNNYLKSSIFDEFIIKFNKSITNIEYEIMKNYDNVNNNYYNKHEINKLIVDLKEFAFKSTINYYTKNEINLALNNKSNINHDHDNTYIKIEEKHNFVYKETLSNIINTKSDINHNHDNEYLTIKEKNNIIYFLGNKINDLNHKLKFTSLFESRLANYDDEKINDLSKNLLNILLNFNIIDEYFKKLANDEIPDYYNKTNIIYNNMLTFDKIFKILYSISNKLDLNENNINDYELLEIKKKWKTNNYFLNYKNC